MIISHKHRFIFIKNRKVGSTSVEQALQPICGPDDVLTPDHLHDTEEDVLLPLARNYQGRFNPAREISQCRRPIDAARVLRDAAKRPRFYNHMRASSVKLVRAANRSPQGMFSRKRVGVSGQDMRKSRACSVARGSVLRAALQVADQGYRGSRAGPEGGPQLLAGIN